MTAGYVLRKVAQSIVTIAAIILLLFVMFRAMPGSPDRAIRNPHFTQQQQEDLRARYGLDRPLIPDQLVVYIESTLSGDLGYSIKYAGRPVIEVVAEAAGPTVLLLGIAEVLAIVIGMALGSIAGWHRGGWVDRLGGGLALVFYSMPYFVVGMPLIIVFAAGLGWFPTSGMTTPGGSSDPVTWLLDLGRHLVLPVTAVTLGLLGAYSILMRSSIIDTRTEDYVTTARAKGLADGRILRTHAFPNAMLPMVTQIAINLGWVVGGAITAEVVFNWPGIGTLTVAALDRRDYPLLQGIFLLVAVSVVLFNLLADLVYGYLDPRVRS